MIEPFSGRAILCMFVRYIYRVYNHEREDRFSASSDYCGFYTMFNINGTDSNVTLRKYTTEQNSTEFSPCLPWKGHLRKFLSVVTLLIKVGTH